ncbi:MAG: Dyp-type peroxidase, partial [Acidimicrobiales bacterium]|nr:Dyp-type peroxidase [Acidimicrobiales bacterium]
GPDGQLRIPVSAHVRQAAPSRNGGASLLRRGYTYTEGVDPTSGELDAGLFFVCFQRDPTAQFARIQQRLSENDALAAYLVATGSGVFACPAGVTGGRPWGAELLQAARL